MSVFTKQQRIAELAARYPENALTSLNHHIDLEWLKEAYHRVRKDGAPGVDGRTWRDYGEDLDANLSALLTRVKLGQYRAPPVRRAHIPKGDGKETRPIGIPCIEDKVLQRAVVMILEPIYEQEFKSFSYGFRPGRSAHQALQELWTQTMNKNIRWVIDLDIRKFFDTVDHGQLRDIVRQRVNDGVICRLISKWLHAGVMEEGKLSYPDCGTPQGGVISPILSNIYLHEVLDKWFVESVGPRLKGRWSIIRFADDAVMGFECQEDAQRVLEVLPKRFGRFGLTLHPDKTRLVSFSPPSRRSNGDEDDGQSGTFDFLSFTHYWGRSVRGKWVVKRKTSSSRLTRALKAARLWCRKKRHLEPKEQQAALSLKLLGHYAYFGITGNMRSLSIFKHELERIWRTWLNRRSRGNPLPWPRFKEMLKEHLKLPSPRIVHSYCSANP